ncbi:MAG: hypothetical protein EBT61_03000 [Verrucomicrobia bacterium]|nr:hypothetical protein [Verrucomicrobiota bacterium]
MCWHLGGSQGDLAQLRAEDIDWNNQTVSFFRHKTGTVTLQHLGPEAMRLLSLHSYRYAWAERAKSAGYPERFAQEALGHNSKAVHRAYARRALVKLPSLEEYEARAAAAQT